MKNKYLPINISMHERRCLVVGGGKVAVRKIDNLIDYGADITVIAEEADDKIKYYRDRGLVKLEERSYIKNDATAFGLVIAACNDEAVNKQVYDDCHNVGIPVNVVDNPPLCDFIFPATIRRHHLSVAVSTDGTAPFLASHLKIILDTIFPEHWEKIADYAAYFRDELKRRFPGNKLRQEACIDRFLNADWKEILKEKDGGQIKDVLIEMLETTDHDQD